MATSMTPYSPTARRLPTTRRLKISLRTSPVEKHLSSSESIPRSNLPRWANLQSLRLLSRFSPTIKAQMNIALQERSYSLPSQALLQVKSCLESQRFLPFQPLSWLHMPSELELSRFQLKEESCISVRTRWIPTRTHSLTFVSISSLWMELRLRFRFSTTSSTTSTRATLVFKRRSSRTFASITSITIKFPRLLCTQIPMCSTSSLVLMKSTRKTHPLPCPSPWNSALARTEKPSSLLLQLPSQSLSLIQLWFPLLTSLLSLFLRALPCKSLLIWEVLPLNTFLC